MNDENHETIREWQTPQGGWSVPGHQSGEEQQKRKNPQMKTEAIYEPKGEAEEYSRLALNLYRGCEHRCRYCYGPGTTHTDPEQYFNKANPKKGILAKVEKDARKLADQPDIPSIHLSFMGDVYQPAEMELGLTREAIEILMSYGLPFTILTKGGTRAVRDFDLLERYDRSSFGSTIVFTSQNDADYWEPGAPSIRDRIEAIYEARRRGIRTWVSLEPVIDPKQALELIECFYPVVGHWKIGKLNHDPETEKKVDWRGFREDARALLEKVGADYFFKSSLGRV